MNELEWLQQWYLSHCDGKWEHHFGVKIGTLDNPGWTLLVDLDGTNTRIEPFADIEVERNENDWYSCTMGPYQTENTPRDTVFQAACGPLNLSEVIAIFRTWVS